MSSTEEYIFPGLDDAEVHLPDNDTLTRYLDSYFTTTHYSYPFLEEYATRQLLEVPREALDPVHRALLYALCSHGADAPGLAGSISSEGERYMQLAWKALPSLLSRPFRSTVQVLLLLCFSLRHVGLPAQGFALNVDGLLTLSRYSATRTVLRGRSRRWQSGSDSAMGCTWRARGHWPVSMLASVRCLPSSLSGLFISRD